VAAWPFVDTRAAAAAAAVTWALALAVRARHQAEQLVLRLRPRLVTLWTLQRRPRLAWLP
jgi:hypothetical protein